VDAIAAFAQRPRDLVKATGTRPDDDALRLDVVRRRHLLQGAIELRPMLCAAAGLCAVDPGECNRAEHDDGQCGATPRRPGGAVGSVEMQHDSASPERSAVEQDQRPVDPEM
jgi:hypothetical protein